MKNTLILLSSLFFFTNFLLADDPFDILSYDVNMKVHKDGSVDVEEVIKVNFNEPRRGIFRYIPIRYKQEAIPEGERKARRARGQQIYQLFLEDIEVPGNPYVTFEEGANLNIRIGDRDITHTGQKTYTIRYKVWGALNDFEDWIELSWNVIGTDWGVPIRETAFLVEFDEAVELKPEDVIAVRGRKGSKDKVTGIDIGRKSVRAIIDGRLRSKEGVSLGIAVPPGYFTSTYIDPARFSRSCIVENVDISGKLLPDGSIEVSEIWEVNFKNSYPYFKRVIEGSSYNTQFESWQYPYISDEEVSTDAGVTRYQIDRGGDQAYIKVMPANGMFKGDVVIELDYKLYGVVAANNTFQYMRFPAVDFEPADPVFSANVGLDLSAINDLELDETSWVINDEDVNLRSASTSNESIQASAQWDARQMNSFAIRSSFRTDQIDYSKMPEEVFYRNYMIPEYEITLDLDPESPPHPMAINLRESFDVKTRQPQERVHIPLNCLKQYSKRSLSLKDGYMPGRKLFGPTKIDALKTNEVSGDIIATTNECSGVTTVEGGRVNIERNLQETMSHENGRKQFMAMLSKDDSEPVRMLTLHIPAGSSGSGDQLEAKIVSGDLERSIPLTLSNGQWIGQLEGPITFRNDPWVLVVNTPKTMGYDYSLLYKLGMFRKYNAGLTTSAILSLIVILIWYVFGRDKRWDGTVYSRPPEDITSAEAGFLWDEKLHKRDLTSLIFQWASQGHMRIEEVDTGDEKPDYRLVKLKDLPPSAKKFERTLFEGIFDGVDINDHILVSDMRDTLYRDMKKAHKQLMRSKRAKAFFTPGTLTASKIMMVFGGFILLISLIAGGIGLVTANFAPAVSLFIFGIICLVFGKKMPQKSPFGTSAFHQLMGFKSFIKTAKLEELQKLYKEDSSYFNNTIAYAIVMGLGETWAKRFADIATKPPEYYVPASPWHDFTTIILADHMMRSMRRMNHDFNYVKPPTPSSSTSSWGGSGGSSFGGGFSSGGGFGGGGGGAW